MNIRETFDNIQSITCSSVSVPTNPSFYEKNVYSNIYNQQYLYLVIPEIKGPYRGGNALTSNAFSKLLVDPSSNVKGLSNTNSFTNLIVNENEIFDYSPVSAGKIDKMTLNLMNKNGNFINFGIDKLFIESIEEGVERTNSYCGKPFISTFITIQQTNDEYSKYCNQYYRTDCNYLNSHPIIEADKLYFYNTFPSKDQIIFLEEYITISKVKYVNDLLLHVYFSYKKNGKNIPVLLQNLIPTPLLKNYYVVLFDKNDNSTNYFSIDSFTSTYTILISTDKIGKYSNYRIGIAQKNMRGENDTDIGSFFSNNGFYVYTIDPINPFKIEINYPYHQLPNNIKNNYNSGDIFLIQDKMQISYNFQITISIKDYGDVHSKLNESGNN
jgi:hypothetical protein